jgi:hypothetical protein
MFFWLNVCLWPSCCAAGKYFAAASAVLAPKGLMIRSSQIVGSFVLLNGISHLLDVRLWGK